jgi:hypothetical protein
MTEPTTEAGKRMFADIIADHELDPRDVLAIEAEARAAVLRELREEIVANMDFLSTGAKWDTTYSPQEGVSLEKLLAAIDRRLGG